MDTEGHGLPPQFRRECVTLVLCLLVLCAPNALARGGGGCLEEGTPVLTPSGYAPIERLRPGDAILTVRDGRLQTSRVSACMRVEPRAYVEIRVGDRAIRATPEHPFAVGPGEFRVADRIAAGDRVLLSQGVEIAAATVSAVARVQSTMPARNLLVAPDATFVAGGFVVHNKGCFLPETPVLRADGTATAISSIRAGDSVLAFRPDGAVVTATVNVVLTNRVEEYFVVTTEKVVLNVTREHPFYVGEGTFRTLEVLKAGDSVIAWDGRGLCSQRIADIRRVAQSIAVYNLQTDDPHTFFAAGIAVHNKGGCLATGTRVDTPSGPRNIETLAPGDVVTGVSAAGDRVPVAVESIAAVRAPCEVLRTDRGALRVTADHPLAVTPDTFRVASRWEAGQSLLATGSKGGSARVLSREECGDVETAFHVVVGAPHTFVAGGLVVHNKGCFLPETPILRADGTAAAISSIRAGDSVLAFRPDGAVVTATVHNVTCREAGSYAVVTTEKAVLHVTREHPFYVGEGTFRVLEALKAGDGIYAFDGAGLSRQRIVNIRAVDARVRVYNLQTDEPHTFFAAGVAVHNKGGGGGGFRSHSGSRSGSSSGDPTAALIFFGMIAAVVIFSAIKSARDKKEENLDFCYSPRQVAKKADKTRKLLEFIAKQDPVFDPAALEKIARSVFLKLQVCWQERNYEPMKPVLMPDLYRQHLQQIAGMVRNHEINKMENLRIDRVDLVNVRYTHKPNQREFTALFTATMKDTYVDDRSGKFLRGDDAPAQFQEFWTFHWQDGGWLLREIEQTRESDVLKDENFFEAFTDTQVEQVMGESVEKTGPAGPWLEKDVATKATRIERMLNFLYETDKIWNRQEMMEGARQLFAELYMAREAGLLADEVAARLYPAVTADLRTEIAHNRSAGRTMEFRNFCVRKVEIILLRNYADPSRDEYLTRISAHAQVVVRQGGVAVREDAYVHPFEEYWCFGRLDKVWKLKQILPPAEGQTAMAEENLDEESSPDQVQWYYTKKRTV